LTCDAGAFANQKALPDPLLVEPHILLQPTNSSHDRSPDIQAAINKLAAKGGGVVGEFALPIVGLR
jgi:hypothetical protein